ncbi:Metallo-dependent phosphatase-like protein [Roridomyces roridus]|uniref:Purple acid phosphatase n=1 Tax=Roridomyces roridus TaxID=1738132 RepID=A0AAD7C0E4_9AGAR|nr:Metallo-dependent phosphatase-like protein [Roridomyces roridus]
MLSGILLGAALLFGTGILAQPELPTIPADLSTPVQQRLAFNGPTSMRVGWSTYERLGKPTVEFGVFPHLMTRSASSESSTTYPTSRTWSNTVTLTGLLPYTTYYYKILSTNSTIGSFKTARVAGDHSPYNMAGVIDMGVFGPDGLSTRPTSFTGMPIPDQLKPGDHTTIQALAATLAQYEFILHPGDFAYADSWLFELGLGYINGTQAQGPAIYEGLIEQFFDQLSILSGSKAYMVTAGNHESNCLNGKSPGEASCPIGQTNFTGFVNRFSELMPETPDSIVGVRPRFDTGLEGARMKARALAASKTGALPPFWYSFDYGMTHYLLFDTETDLGNGIIGPDEAGGTQGDSDGPFGSYMNQQVDFMDRDLASVDRKLTPWVFVSGHRPWYVDSGPCTVCQQAFEPILLKHKVDVAYFGHVHNMQLLGPLANNTRDPAGYDNPSAPVYVVNGAAGHFEGLDLLTTPDKLPSYGIEWFNNGTLYGYNMFKFLDKDHLEIEFISSKDGTVVNSVTLFKKH